MTKLNIPLPGRDYDILIEPGLLDQAGAHCRTVLPRAKKLAVVTDGKESCSSQLCGQDHHDPGG